MNHRHNTITIELAGMEVKIGVVEKQLTETDEHDHIRLLDEWEGFAEVRVDIPPEKAMAVFRAFYRSELLHGSHKHAGAATARMRSIAVYRSMAQGENEFYIGFSVFTA